jgi:hypothetical protein
MTTGRTHGQSRTPSSDRSLALTHRCSSQARQTSGTPQAAIAILLRASGQAPSCIEHGIAQLMAPAQAADLIDSLRNARVTLTYDPDTKTIRTANDTGVAVTTGGHR